MQAISEPRDGVRDVKGRPVKAFIGNDEVEAVAGNRRVGEGDSVGRAHAGACRA